MEIDYLTEEGITMRNATKDEIYNKKVEKSSNLHRLKLFLFVVCYIVLTLFIIHLTFVTKESTFHLNKYILATILTQGQVLVAVCITLLRIKRSYLVSITLCGLSLIITLLRVVSTGTLLILPGVFISFTSIIICIVINRFKQKLTAKEKEFMLSNELLQNVLDTIPMPIFWKDLNSNFLGCNQYFADEAGMSSTKQIIGKNDYDTPSSTQTEKYRADDAEIMKGGVAKVNIEELHIYPNGEQGWIRTSKVPLRDSNGEIFGLLGVFEDITKKKYAEQELYYEKERLKITLLAIGDAVITTDQNMKITLINPVAEALTGWDAKDALGKEVGLVLTLENEMTGIKGRNPIKEVLLNLKTVELENKYSIVSKQGHKRTIEDSAAPILGENGDILGVVMVFRDVTDKKIKQDEILYLSYHDSLTKLYNRRYIEEKMKQIEELEHYPLSIILGDINGLKMVNDVLGHYEGDRFLKEASRILTESCRQSDIVARWGGDEFLILLPNTNASEAEMICESINKKCAELASMSIKLSISLGYAVRKNDNEEITKTINTAEEVMYTQKMLNSRSYRYSILDSFRKTLFEKSHETEEHANRLMRLSKHMGEVMNLPQTTLQELELLGVLHDIGKIGVPDSILNKPGKLDEDEWVVMKRHSEIGSRITQSVPEFDRISDYILSHHERWDGKGYPRGLKGEEIPIQSRILSIVDAYDAMTSERPYHSPMTHEDALQELIKNAGKQFDPELIQLVIKERILEFDREKA
jgi:diguanylate cyclase (GGDEF)-like protein/PAS domain S-box-containing protein